MNVFQQSLMSMAFILGTLLFVSCEQPVLSVSEVLGDYKGTLSFVQQGVTGTPVVVGVAETTVTSPDNNKLAISFPSTKVLSYELPIFAVECGMYYDESKGYYTLSGEPFIDLGGYGKSISTVSGTANGGVIELQLELTALPITLQYTGYKKTAK